MGKVLQVAGAIIGAAIVGVAAWVCGDAHGKQKGSKEGYAKASAEYEKKLRRQAEEFYAAKAQLKSNSKKKDMLIKKLIAALRESRNEEFKEFATGMVEKLKAA